MTLQELVIRTLEDAGYPQTKGHYVRVPGSSCRWRKTRSGFYIGSWITGVYLSWSFSHEYLEKNFRDLSPEYRQKESEMLAVLQGAGFHAYSPKKGGHIIVCCLDQSHSTHNKSSRHLPCISF